MTATNLSRSTHRLSREQIRAARMAPLVPFVQQRGLQLMEREAGNFILPAYPGLIVKDSYWRWPKRNLAGNAIDFCAQDLPMMSRQTMRQGKAAQSSWHNFAQGDGLRRTGP